MAPTMIEGLEPKSGGLYNGSSGHSLTCRVECMPSCQIKWLKNGLVIEERARNDTGTQYQVLSRDYPEQLHFNNLAGVLSTLVWTNSESNRESNLSMASSGLFDRHQDNGVNFSCVSTNNSIGPAVQSHTTFFVECK